MTYKRYAAWAMTRAMIMFILGGILVACGNAEDNTAEESQVLTVFAASSLTNAFEALALAFEAEQNNVEVRLNFGGSSTLATQITEGATADVFASANPVQMQRVADLTQTPPLTFAQNRLVVLVNAESTLQTLDDLREGNVKLVSAAPDVPIRVYTEQVWDSLGADYAEAMRANLLSEEINVRQAVLKVALGEADAAFVYATDQTPDIIENTRLIEIPDSHNVIADYPIAPISDRPLSEAFIDFVLSAQGQAILENWGFRSGERG